MEGSDLEDVPAGETVSGLLVSAREELGLSQKDVADMLFLQVTFIQKIDEGLFQKLPKRAYIRGYLRSYARALGLDGDHVVKLYEDESASEHSSDEKDLVEERIGGAVVTAPLLKTGLVGLVPLFVVLLLVWFVSNNTKEVEAIDEQIYPDLVLQEGSETAEKVANLEAGIDPSQVALPVDLNQVGLSTEANNRLEDSTDKIIEESEPKKDTPNTIEEIKGISLKRSIEGGTEYIIVEAGGDDHIELSFLEECWVEVEDGEGYSIYGDLNGEKEILNIYGIAPFKVLLGRAAVVNMSFNGEDIDLLEYADIDQIAEVKLGTP